MRAQHFRPLADGFLLEPMDQSFPIRLVGGQDQIPEHPVGIQRVPNRLACDQNAVRYGGHLCDHMVRFQRVHQRAIHVEDHGADG